MAYLYETEECRDKILEGGKKVYWEIHAEYMNKLKKLKNKIKKRPDKLGFILEDIEGVLKEMEKNWVVPEGFADQEISRMHREIQSPSGEFKEMKEKVEKKLKKFKK